MIQSKWPKTLPPLTPEEVEINNEFMRYWHEVLPQKYSVADKFCHRYPVRHSPSSVVRTLEVGAGIGEHLAYETLTTEQQKNYVALETRQNMAEQMRRRFPRIRTLLGDCQKRLEFPDGYFDRIIAINILEHLPNLPAALREMHRLCDKEAGTFLAVIPCEGGFAYGLAREISAKRIFEKRFKRPYSVFIDQEHINVPEEILAELDPFFEVADRTFFPIPLPFEFCNLFIGLTLRPRRQIKGTSPVC